MAKISKTKHENPRQLAGIFVCKLLSVLFFDFSSGF